MRPDDDEQHQRQRDLPAHQQLTGAVATPAGRVAAAALVQRGGERCEAQQRESTPNASAVSTVNASVKATTTPSRRTSSRRGRFAGPKATSSRMAPERAPARPHRPRSRAARSRPGRSARCRRCPRQAPGGRRLPAAVPPTGPGTGSRRSRTRRAARDLPRPAGSRARRATRPTMRPISAVAVDTSLPCSDGPGRRTPAAGRRSAGQLGARVGDRRTVAQPRHAMSSSSRRTPSRV